MPYAVVTWSVADVPTGDAIRDAARKCLEGRTTCVIHGDVRITTVASGTDFLRLVVCLEALGTANHGDFTWSAHLLQKNAATETNADVDQDCVADVMGN